MGWLWSSSKEPPPSSTGELEKRDDSSTQSPVADVLSKAPTSSRKLTRDEQADLELQTLLEELSYAPSDFPPSSIPTPSFKEPSQNSNSTAPAHSPASLSSPERSALAASPIAPPRLLPTEMSCRAAFDQAYHCQLPGGQFGHVYRYGALRNCSQLWSNFWFCMRTNRGYMSDEQRVNAIRQHYWEREAKYRTGPSSEDVWRVRTDVQDKPFSGDFEEVRQMLAEQQRQEEKRAEMARKAGNADS